MDFGGRRIAMGTYLKKYEEGLPLHKKGERRPVEIRPVGLKADIKNPVFIKSGAVEGR